MIDDRSQAETQGPEWESVATSATPTKQARAYVRHVRPVLQSGKYERCCLTSFAKVSTRALYATTRAGYSLHDLEMRALCALGSFVLCDSTGTGIIQCEEFISEWHASRKQTKVQGAIIGLARRGYVQLFDQRKNGTRYIGITPLGAKVLDVFYSKCEELISRIGFYRTQTEYVERPLRFQKVDIAHVDNLYTRSLTTKNRHLYDASKYYNPDGSIKN